MHLRRAISFNSNPRNVSTDVRTRRSVPFLRRHEDTLCGHFCDHHHRDGLGLEVLVHHLAAERVSYVSRVRARLIAWRTAGTYVSFGDDFVECAIHCISMNGLKGDEKRTFGGFGKCCFELRLGICLMGSLTLGRDCRTAIT